MGIISTLAASLTPYTAGEQPQDRRYIKLNTNENPYPPCPSIAEALATFDTDKLRRYSDPDNAKLKAAVAEHEGVAIGNIFVGNGSDEVLAMCFPSFCNTTCAFADVTYSFYTVYCSLYSIKPIILPLDDNFRPKLPEYLKVTSDMIIITNPNAPTGIAWTLEDIESVVSNNRDKAIIIDEAYGAFMGYSAVGLTSKYDNILVVKTFSKAYALAGARCGYAVGNIQLIRALDTVKNCFNSYTVNALTEQIATIAVQDVDYYNKTIELICATRERAKDTLSSLGFEVLPSSANFVFVTHNRVGAKDIYLKLKQVGILTRYFNKPRIDNYLRVTIGTDGDMAELYKQLRLIVMV